jgi:ABC-type transport system substrate-binding protein
VQHRQITRRTLYALGAVAVLAAAACSSSSSPSTPSSSSSSAKTNSGMGTQPLVVESAEVSPLTDTFNPLNASQSTGYSLHADDLIYEPLFLFNLMQPTQAPVPMLATTYQWSTDGKTLTLTTRTGVHWDPSPDLGHGYRAEHRGAHVLHPRGGEHVRDRLSADRLAARLAGGR